MFGDYNPIKLIVLPLGAFLASLDFIDKDARKFMCSCVVCPGMVGDI